MITNQEELRAAATMITACVNAMCNAKDTDEVSRRFIEAKDLLIDIYKFNAEKHSTTI